MFSLRLHLTCLSFAFFFKSLARHTKSTLLFIKTSIAYQHLNLKSFLHSTCSLSVYIYIFTFEEGSPHCYKITFQQLYKAVYC